MFYWIYDYPSLNIGLLFGFVFVAAIWVAILFSHRFLHAWIHTETRTNEMVGFAFSSFFVLYGLLLGLLAVASYQNFSNVTDIVSKEASSLAALYHDFRGYPEPTKSRLQDELRDYTRELIDRSWSEQQKGIVSAEEAHRVTQLMDEVMTFKPSEKSDEISHAETLRQLNNFVELRGNRLANVTTGIPAVLWWVVALGALISIMMIAMFDMEIHVHLILGSALAVFLGAVIFVVAAMDNPFRGQLSVGTEPFEAVYQTLMKPNDVVSKSMTALMAKSTKLGEATLGGKAPVAGKVVPALYFGTTMMNNYFNVVDEVVAENGGTATIFVKAADEYVRVATNVKKDDGSRAIGTILDPKGPAFEAINKGGAFYGEATILGKPYITAYEPIRDASTKIIGIYYVGYMK